MKCPKCKDAVLTEVQAGPGMAVDLCRSCSGAWLDKSEIYRFVQQPQRLYDELAKAFQSVYPSDFSCPRCGRMMLHARLESADIVLEACPGCGGTWFDAGEVQKLQAAIAEAGPKAAPAPGERRTPAPGASGRLLTDMEVATVFGGDLTASLAVVFAAAGVLASVAGILLGAMKKLPIRVEDAGLLLALILPVSGLLSFLARARGRSRRQARLFSGTVIGVKNLASGPWGEVELKVRFLHEGTAHEITRRVGYRLFSDVAVGSSVGIVVPPGGPEGARVARIH
ncbi:MAG: zf-TFIIB domain-containing protein [Elusimicrobia bacterium]|nr:zf-TFIIB domain-containing protein [Elusimicrobiota bacterium]